MRVLLLVLTGCALQTTLATVDDEKTVPAIVVPDERMSFELTFRGIRVMSVQTGVGEPGWVDNKHAVIVKSHGKSEGIVSVLGDVVFDIETTLDLETGTPIEHHVEAWIHVVGQRDQHNDDRHVFSDGVYDVHSAICALRGWHAPLDVHRTFAIRELGGGSFDVDIWPAAVEHVGNRPALRFDGISEGQHFSLWLSDDLARVPLQASGDTEFGTIMVSLIDYG